jgi:hypothetical protein
MKKQKSTNPKDRNTYENLKPKTEKIKKIKKKIDNFLKINFLHLGTKYFY